MLEFLVEENPNLDNPNPQDNGQDNGPFWASPLQYT